MKPSPIRVLRDLMLGGRHSRRTIAAMADGPSLVTADRWIRALVALVPGVRTVRVSKTTWVQWSSTPKKERKDRRAMIDLDAVDWPALSPAEVFAALTRAPKVAGVFLSGHTGAWSWWVWPPSMADGSADSRVEACAAADAALRAAGWLLVEDQ